MRQLAFQRQQQRLAQEEKAQAQEQAAAQAEEARKKARNDKIKKGVFGAIKFGGNATKNTAKGTANFVGQGFTEHNVTRGLAGIFIFFVFATHAIDVLTGFNRTTMGIMWLMWWVVVTFLIAPIMLRTPDETYGYMLKHKVPFFAVFSALTFLLPSIIDLLPVGVQDQTLFKFGIILLPMWMIYIVFIDQHAAAPWLRNAYLVLLVIIMLSMMIGLINQSNIPLELQSEYQFNPAETLKDVVFDVQHNFGNFFKRVFNLGPSIMASFTTNLNDSIGINYQSRVDSGSSRDLGVRIANMEAKRVDPEPYPGQQYDSETIVWADFVGESMGDEPIRLSTRCYAKKRNDPEIEGELVMGRNMNPNNILITHLETHSASCTFKNLPEGRYEVFFTGTFSARSWSYLTYYFAPYDLVREYGDEGKDIFQEARITPMKVARQSAGAVALGISNIDRQPVPVRTNQTDLQTRFGASVGNKWTGGELNSVNTIELMVSPPFILTSCDRQPVQGTREEPQHTIDAQGYRRYNFTDVNSPTHFTSVNCFISFDDAPSLQEFLAGYNIVARTFAAETTYLYTIKQSIFVQVPSNGIPLA